MKKFQFRLETLLKYRQIREDQAKMVLAEADRVLMKEKAVLESLETVLANTIEALYQKQKKAIIAEELTLYDTYIVATENNIAVQTGKVAAAEKHRETCLKKLEEAMKQRKLVDNLKNKQLEKYYIEFLREEQKYLDEIGTQKSVRDKVSVI